MYSTMSDDPLEFKWNFCNNFLFSSSDKDLKEKLTKFDEFFSILAIQQKNDMGMFSISPTFQIHYNKMKNIF